MLKAVNDARVVHLLFWVAGLASVLLVVQMGHPYDETEHAHVAWLMGKLGQRPLDDFFQHHMPLLWDILKVYFLLGFDGPEVLYFGRLLVVLSMLVVGLGWVQLARLLTSSRIEADYAAALGIGSFALLFLMMPDIIVIRPETLAAASWVLSCLCWRYAFARSPDQDKFCLASGAFYCASLFFSPRMLFLIGWLGFLSGWRPSLKQVVFWVLGAAAFLLAYLSVCGCSLKYLYFAPYYSSVLQKVGGWDTASLLPWCPEPRPLLILGVVWVVLFRISSAQGRKTSWVHLGYLGLTCVAGWSSGYPHLYLQNFFPSYLSLSSSCLFLATQIRWEAFPSPRRLVQWGLVGVCAWLVYSTRALVDSDLTIFHIVELRRHVLGYLAPSDTVMMCYQMHPICARDASYYGPWLGDSQNRMGEAVATVQQRFALPRFSYLEDLKSARPRLVDTDLDLALHENEVPGLRGYLCENYDTLLWRRRGIPLLLLRRETTATPTH